MATDGVEHGGLPDQTEVSIYLIDVNDNSPRFENLDATIMVEEVCHCLQRTYHDTNTPLLSCLLEHKYRDHNI